METRATLSMRQEQQEKALFLFVVVVGYIITFTVASNGETVYSIQQLLFGISFGVVYLIFGFFDTDILRRFPPRIKNTLYFPIQIILVLCIGWELGPGGNWLIGLPLAGIAVERLFSPWRWFIYLGLLAAIILPILRYSTRDIAFINAAVISSLIFFIAVVTQFRLNEQQARERAEKLTMELEAANHRLAEYASQAEELAAVRERNRLAHEIHDNLGHYLTIINVQIEAAGILLDSDPDRTRQALDKAHEFIRKGLVSVRESVSSLRASPVENRSLREALATLIDETQTSGIDVAFNVLGAPRAIEEKVALTFYRVAQEALTNVRKHAHATHVDVELDLSQLDGIGLLVRDNGMGAADTSGGFGLLGIRERVHLLGGTCHIETRIGKGFYLQVVVPVKERVGG